MSAPGRVTNDPTNYIAMGIQSAKDVDATTFYFLKHLDGSGFDTTTDDSKERVGGSGREVGLRYRMKVTADGQFVAYSQPDFAGRALTQAIGQDVVTPSAIAGFPAFTHNINTGASSLPYVTIEQAWADEIERTTNCLIADCKIEFEAGRPLKITSQFITGGTMHYTSVAQSPVREAAFPHMYPGASAAITAGPYAAGQVGASSLQITKGSVEIKNTLDDAIQTVALNREDVTWLNLDIDIDGTLKYINNSFWQQVTYGGGSQVPTGLLTNGQFTLFSPGPSSQSITIFAPFIEFSALKVNRLDPDGKTMYIDYAGSTRNIGTQSLQVDVVSTASASYLLSTT